MQVNKDQTQKESSLAEKRKLLLFLRMSAHSNSLKNHALIRKVRKEIAREMTFINNGRKAKNSFN